MSGEIAKALDRLNHRKAAIVSDDASLGVDDLVALLSGHDLVAGEVRRAIGAAAHQGSDLADANDPEAIGAALFIDGLAVGLLIAEAREGAGS